MGVLGCILMVILVIVTIVLILFTLFIFSVFMFTGVALGFDSSAAFVFLAILIILISCIYGLVVLGESGYLSSPKTPETENSEVIEKINELENQRTEVCPLFF